MKKTLALPRRRGPFRPDKVLDISVHSEDGWGGFLPWANSSHAPGENPHSLIQGLF